jgi:hypothetical protein
MGEWRDSTIILNLGTRWRWVVSFMFCLAYFIPRKEAGWVGTRVGWTLMRREKCPAR